MKKRINNNFDIKSSLYTRFPERNNTTRDIRVSGNKQILTLLDWLYKDATIFMQRKYDKYIKAKKL